MIFCNWHKKIKPDTEYVGKKINYYKSVNSTNTVAKITECNNGTIFIAERQTAGKGRMGRNWISDKNCGIWMSIALMPDINPEQINCLTLIAGLAVCDTLNKLYNLPFKIKWPNDIVIDNKKICGILTEGEIYNGKVKKVIVGIGINVNTKSFLDELKDIATSLYIASGKKGNRAKIINEFAEIFEKYYKSFLNEDSDIIEEYKKLCITINKEVVAIKNNEQIKGIATDITKTGELTIKKTDGTTLNINSGEVSVRGIYGYI